MRPRPIVLCAAIFALLVAALWAFPQFWYRRAPSSAPKLWLTGQTNLAGWTFKETPVAAQQEAVLDADRTLCGEFTRGTEMVQVFTAKRFSDDLNEIGLFVHTPDRCWVGAGWKLKASQPEYVEIDLQGTKAIFERRIFVWRNGEEVLVYFGGLSAGESLPYRLDHNLSIAQKSQITAATTPSNARPSPIDARFWGRIWDAFATQTQTRGPKQFIRIATTLRRSETEGDERLKKVLQEWLQPGDYAAELQAWRSSRPKGKG